MEGDTIAVFTALGFEQEGTDAILSYRNNHAILSFPKEVDTTALFTGILPCQYSGGGLSYRLHFTADGDTNPIGNFMWCISVERIGNNYQNIDVDSFAAESTILYGVPASGNIIVCGASGINLDGLTAGECYRLKIRRSGTNDLSTATAQLLAVELREI